MPGSPGYLEVSSFVLRINATANVDRAQGDIHPQGNPHIQTNPHNVAVIAGVLAKRMAEIDPKQAEAYVAGYEAFDARWKTAIDEWEERAAPLRGKRIITHHKSWVYLEQWLGLEEAGNLEAIAGLPPTATHLSLLTKKFENGGADVIVRSPYQDDRPSMWLSDRTGIPAIVLPLTVGGSDEASNLFSLYDDVINRLLGAIQ